MDQNTMTVSSDEMERLLREMDRPARPIPALVSLIQETNRG